jgi:hypothetical protein
MLKLLKRIFLGRDLKDALNQTTFIKVHGIRFYIKKADPIAFLDGSKVLLQCFDTYKLKSEKEVPQATSNALKKLEEHYIDIFMSTIIEPKLARSTEKAQDGEIPVQHLFTDWDLANELYARIVEFTYGKKKFKLNTSLAKSS